MTAEWEERTAARLTRGTSPSPEALPEGAKLTLEAMARYASDPFRGAVQRRIMPEGMTTHEMEASAAREALSRAGIGLDHVDVLLVQTIVPEQLLPNTACNTHRLLGLKRDTLVISTEVACNAFAVHASLAQALIASGQARHVLSVHSSAMNRLLRRSEPDSAWWGDGAGAVVYGAVSDGRGLLAVTHRADGASSNAIVLGVPGQRWWESGAIQLHSPERDQTRSMLFGIAERAREAIHSSMAQARLAPADVDFYASHQGTVWLTEVTAKYAGIDKAKTVSTFPSFGNISSVNLPLILAIAEREHLIEPGSTIVTFSGGAGETWSSVALRWGR
ncbi:MAG TPA: 3-oxoacyl-[acyl-carrier-protein] synthase III C-terminal domain-containing protein [Kofleriaceae bacterium]